MSQYRWSVAYSAERDPRDGNRIYKNPFEPILDGLLSFLAFLTREGVTGEVYVRDWRLPAGYFELDLVSRLGFSWRPA